MDLLISILLGLWFAATVIVQLPQSRFKSLRRLDPTGHLLPGWHFFSKPLRADYDLLYLPWITIGSASKPGGWVSASPVVKRSFSHSWVYPTRRVRKVFFQTCHRLVLAQQQKANHYDLILSAPYLLLLDWVTSMCPNATAIEFRIDFVIYGERVVRSTAFRSECHLASDISND
jgi:hypothetical protein